VSDPIRVLVVDDEEIVGKRLKQALTKVGYEVETFLDGKDALARLAERSFDVVVTDIRMDEVDGLEVLRQVRESTPRTKVIIITGYATIETAREALVKGAFEFIAKPFRPKELRKVVERAVEALRAETPR